MLITLKTFKERDPTCFTHNTLQITQEWCLHSGKLDITLDLQYKGLHIFHTKRISNHSKMLHSVNLFVRNSEKMDITQHLEKNRSHLLHIQEILNLSRQVHTLNSSHHPFSKAGYHSTPSKKNTSHLPHSRGFQITQEWCILSVHHISYSNKVDIIQNLERSRCHLLHIPKISNHWSMVFLLNPSAHTVRKGGYHSRPWREKMSPSPHSKCHSNMVHSLNLEWYNFSIHHVIHSGKVVITLDLERSKRYLLNIQEISNHSTMVHSFNSSLHRPFKSW